MKLNSRSTFNRPDGLWRGGTIIDDAWENGPTTSPSDSSRSPSPTKRKLISTFSVYSWQIQFGQTPKFRYPVPVSPAVFSEPSTHATIQLSHLSLSAMVHCWRYLGINPYNTPWPCSYTHISTFPRRSGALVPVTHIVKECTAFGNLQSLAQSRQFTMQEDGVDVFISVTLRITRGVSRKRECSSSCGWETCQWDDQGCDGDWSFERRKQSLGALSDCKITITF